MSARLSWRSARTAWRTSSIDVDAMLTCLAGWPAVQAMADAPRRQTPTITARVLRTIVLQTRNDSCRSRKAKATPATSALVLAEQPLEIAVRALFQQREPQQHARLLRVEVERCDEARLVVVHFDVAADASRGHARRADADDAILGVFLERLQGRRR